MIRSRVPVRHCSWWSAWYPASWTGFSLSNISRSAASYGEYEDPDNSYPPKWAYSNLFRLANNVRRALGDTFGRLVDVPGHFTGTLCYFMDISGALVRALLKGDLNSY